MDGRTGEHKLRKENGVSMTENQKTFYRLLKKKQEAHLTWDEIAKKAHVKLASWMTGTPGTKPSEDDLRKIAPVLNTTYEWLKHGGREEK